MSDIDRKRMIPLHIADQAVAACDAEIAKLREENARLKADNDRLKEAIADSYKAVDEMEKRFKELEAEFEMHPMAVENARLKAVLTESDRLLLVDGEHMVLSISTYLRLKKAGHL
jgi:hypothetical protein